MVPAASPQHPLHHLQRKVTLKDLRAHRQLVVRETGQTRDARTLVEATQRWTVSNMSTSIIAARAGYGYAWLPEYKIRDELVAGTLRALPLREGGERFAELYLVLRRSRRGGSGHAAPRGNHPRIDLRRVHQDAAGLTGGKRRCGCRLK